MKYRVVVSPKLIRDIGRLEASVRGRVIEAVGRLADTPRPHGCKKLRDSGCYRIRVGDYRVVYDIHDRTITVTVIKVGHRRDVYR